MTRITVKQLGEDTAAVISRVAVNREPIIVRRNNKPVAAIVTMDDLAVLREIEDREDLADLRKIRAEIAREGTVPWEQVKTELGLE